MRSPAHRPAIHGRPINLHRVITMKRTFAAPAFILTAALVVSGCKTLDAYTGEEKMSSASKGAMIGAGAGAVVGAISGKGSRDRRKRALIGAGIGGIAGVGVGAYMDKQEAELREQLQGSGVSVTRKGDEVILNMPGNITFRTGSADLNPQFFKVLDSVALVVKKYDQTLVEIVGHTDSVGSDALNQKLSEDRADTVSRYLGGKGILADRMIPIGAGKNHPIASNATEEGRAQNRRVEVSLLPITKE
jgi:outer membrane protein OmpA-like peptidoglycan-associated protein